MPTKRQSWVDYVMQNYSSTSPPPGIFTKAPTLIADSADISGVAPRGVVSWQRMVNFHRNRGGSRLPDYQREALDQAIKILSQRIKERKELVNGYEEDTLLPHKKIKMKDLQKTLDAQSVIGKDACSKTCKYTTKPKKSKRMKAAELALSVVLKRD